MCLECNLNSRGRFLETEVLHSEILYAKKTRGNIFIVDTIILYSYVIMYSKFAENFWTINNLLNLENIIIQEHPAHQQKQRHKYP